MRVVEPRGDARTEAPVDESVIETPITSWRDDERGARLDTLAVEEPLEIRLAGCSVAVTMRTPGDDFDLTLGFLYTEGIIRGMEDISSIAHCPVDNSFPEGTVMVAAARGYPPGPALSNRSNVVNVNPSDPSLVDPDRWRRNFFATSSCGICGKASIQAVRQDAPPISSDARVTSETLLRLERELRRAQTVFGQTGGLHAAGLFDLDGRPLVVREDVGRHNAVDKVVGASLRNGTLAGRGCSRKASTQILMVSGRASFEIVQKALMAGIPMVAAVSAPSSLAVDLAREANLTLVGFLRSGRFNVYAGEERIEKT
jgi:FdhD protein